MNDYPKIGQEPHPDDAKAKQGVKAPPEPGRSAKPAPPPGARKAPPPPAGMDPRELSDLLRSDGDDSEGHRKILGQQEQRLRARQRPNFWRYWARDAGNRIRDMLDGGYAFVVDEEMLDEDEKAVVIARITGTNPDGSPEYSYLMEKPMELHIADQEIKQIPVNDIEAAIQANLVQGAEAEDKGTFYDPRTGPPMPGAPQVVGPQNIQHGTGRHEA